MMRRNINVFLAVCSMVAAIVGSAVGAAPQRQPCDLEDLQYKGVPQQFYEQARANCLAWEAGRQYQQSRPAAEIVAEKQQLHEEHVRELSAMQTDPTGETETFEGLYDGDAIPNPFESSEFTVTSSWMGVVNGKRIGVFSGYIPDAPPQGYLVVFDDRGEIKGKYSAIPSATGPAHLVYEQGGVLTVETLAGDFIVEDPDGTKPPQTVRTPGGDRYMLILKRENSDSV